MQNLHVDNLLRDYAYSKYLERVHTFYFEENNKDATKINLVYYVDGEQKKKSYRKEYINGVTCTQFQKEALNLLNYANPKANISIECVTNNTVIDGKITDGWVLVFKNKKSSKKSAKKSAKKSKKSAKKSKKSLKKSMKRKQ